MLHHAYQIVWSTRSNTFATPDEALMRRELVAARQSAAAAAEGPTTVQISIGTVEAADSRAAIQRIHAGDWSYDQATLEPAPADRYGCEDEIEDSIFECVNEHHIQNVIGYLAALAASTTSETVSEHGDVAPFLEAAEHLRKAQAALRGSQYHSFRKLY